jgi:hypothetical protein
MLERKEIQLNNENVLTINNISSENCWTYENAFYWFSHPCRINKFLAHYELYKTICDLPGDVLELGVYKGASLIRFATYRNLLENDFSRKIVGFDIFGAFPRVNLSSESDLEFIDKFEKAAGDGLHIEDLLKVFERKGFENMQLVKGNVFETIPVFLRANPATRIAFLHLDMDVKEPTEFALDLLYDRVVPNGLIVIDDYNSVSGATDAVDSFCKKRQLEIKKLNNYSVPSFIKKPV